MRFKKARVDLAMRLGTKTVDGLTFAEGIFAITREAGNAKLDWQIVHTQSGLALGNFKNLRRIMETQRGAKLVAEKLVEGLGPDLSRFDVADLTSNLQLLEELKNCLLEITGERLFG